MFNRYAEARIKKSSTNKVRYFKPTLYQDIEEKDTDVIHNVRAGERMDMLAHRYYDDVGFVAHQGGWNDEDGVEGVEIDVYKYNEEQEEYQYHAYLETNETGEAWLYNETCGQYEWYASVDVEKGYYEIWAGCEGTAVSYTHLTLPTKA